MMGDPSKLCIMLILPYFRTLLLLVLLGFPLCSPPFSFASGIKCLDDYDNEITCTHPNETLCVVKYNLIDHVGAGRGDGCATDCWQEDAGNGNVFCGGSSRCCCKGNAETPCNDLRKKEIREQACTVFFFWSEITHWEPGYCPPSKCQNADGQEETCASGKDYCGIDPKTGNALGCVDLSSGCGGKEPNYVESCHQHKCCCTAFSKPCNVLDKENALCKIENANSLLAAPACKAEPGTTGGGKRPSSEASEMDMSSWTIAFSISAVIVLLMHYKI